MRKQLLFICLFFFISIAMTAQISNNKYEKEWKEVEQFDTDNLPQSALQSIDGILKKAIADKNSTQVIKALIYKNKYKRDIDYNDNITLFKDLQTLLAQSNNIAEKALLHSMLAELYADYYQNNQWRIRQRSNLSDTVPDDIKEWSSNIFMNKITENLDLSVKDKKALKAYSTRRYDDIIKIGSDGLKYYPTLYDFLALRTVGVAQAAGNISYSNFDLSSTGMNPEVFFTPAENYVKLNIKADLNKQMCVLRYYQEYLVDLLSRDMIPTIILTDIDRIQYLSQKSQSSSMVSQLESYKALLKKYENDDTAAEIIVKIADTYNNYNQAYSLIAGGKIDNNKEIYDWLNQGIQKYPDSYGGKVLKNKLVDLEMPTLNIEGKPIMHSGQIVKLEITHKNIQALEVQPDFNLYKVEGKKYTIIKSYPLQLISKTTYNFDTLSVDMGTLPIGKYCFSSINEKEMNDELCNSNNKYQNHIEFVVSDLISFSRNSKKDEYEIFVVDRISGKPIKDATIEMYEYNQNQKLDNLLASLKTNEQGLAIYKHTSKKDASNYYNIAIYKVVHGADSCLKSEYLQVNNNYQWEERTNNQDEESISIFTDRSIYRPGQTVYFKAIVVGNDTKVVANEEYTVGLYNVNNELVSELELRTNEFGSIAGNFVLPQNGLSGQYSIEIDDASIYFSVEEYKRPTFEVTFDKVDKTYTFGEEVKVKGFAKTFSGISLQNIDVHYTIEREQYNFWWGGGNQSHFANDTVKTGEDGSFEIVFTPEAGDNSRPLVRPYIDKQIYRFNITATVTDLNGETQSNRFSLIVGNVSMLINIDAPEKMEKSGDDKIKIEARNLQGEIIETSGTYMVYSLDKNDSIQSKMLEGSFETGEQSGLKSKLINLASGKYRLQIKALDSRNNKIEENKDLIIYSFADKKPPVETDKWVVQKNIFYDKDKPAEVIFGTSMKDAYVLYQLSDKEQVFERRVVKISNANQLFTLPYKAEYGNMLNMTFTFIKDEKLYNENISLIKKVEELSDSELKIKMEVFRDKLRPGQEETWSISVKNNKENPAMAELMASIYDMSLDKLRAYMEWNLNRPYAYTDFLYPVNYSLPWQESNYPRNFYLDYSPQYEKVLGRTGDVIKWFGYLNNYYRNNILGGKINPSQYDSYQEEEDGSGLDEVVVVGYGIQRSKSVTSAVVNIRGVASVPEVLQGKVAGVSIVADSESSADGWFNSIGAGGEFIIGNKNMDVAPQVRQNFSETAFFYPQLRTNDKGETLISFTVPESNTTWRFRALAHDKNSKVGTLEQFVVTQKELMVTPNMPRFVRQGDRTNISTKISNLSENAISGDVRIEFFDPATDKLINLKIANQKQTFSVEKDASVSANWTFDIPENIELIGCRIIAQNQTFSDGEQHVLAVLPNRMLVTESMPLDVTTAGTNTFTFDKLYNNSSSTIDNYKLTLEYASNPAWYAVQALSSFSNPTNENAVNWFASYYVNMLGSSITRQYPKVAQMIEAWKKQGGDKQTFASRLQKDEELKNVLLEETPWVLDAKNEAEQIQRLSLLFDLNNTNQLTNSATSKLQELQNKSDGGWSWYKGMYSSRAVSQYILYGYAKLQQVGQVQYPQDIKMMQMNALKYIDSQILKDFESLKKNNKNWEKTTYISTNQLEYAYVRSFYRDIPISKETRTAERFYTNVASKNWQKLDLYEQSILSAILKRNGEKELANKIIKSIREHAVKDPKTGMYWPNNRSHVFMSMSAISVHTFLMEALQENGSSQEEMDMLKRWLINQKRTQIWESTHASIDAISTLLSTGSDWFASEEAPSITVGGQKVEPESKEAGTGYFKKGWDKSEITNEMGKVEITSSNTRPSYGAMYWQYYENLDKITAQKGDLNVEKQLYKENDTPTGKSLTRITENNPLTVGDKVIVRLTIRANRDMEFVQLKDMRAPCFEPLQTISGVKWNESLMYYLTPKDASTNFYFDFMPKGTYVFEYPVYVNRTGEYANGITTIQCMYAPEFVSHTSGIKVTVH